MDLNGFGAHISCFFCVFGAEMPLKWPSEAADKGKKAKIFNFTSYRYVTVIYYRVMGFSPPTMCFLGYSDQKQGFLGVLEYFFTRFWCFLKPKITKNSST